MMNQSDAEYILSKEYGVSSETLSKLIEYHNLIIRWQLRIGTTLILDSTLNNIWERHILDSAQLINHLPKSTCRILDVGSGAGFPGLMLSIMTDHEVNLVESDKDKCSFLRTAIKKFNLSAKVHNCSIEDLPFMGTAYITARYFNPLIKLLELTKKQHHESVKFLVMKGKTVKTDVLNQDDWEHVQIIGIHDSRTIKEDKNQHILELHIKEI